MALIVLFWCIMPRRRLIRTPLFPYHVTARCNNREPFPAPLPKVWEVFEEVLFEANLLFELQVHAFTLMPNHYHLVCSTPKDDLGVVMKRVMESTTRRINLISGRSGHLFGGPYYWTLVDNPAYYGTVLKYVYRNPVRAGLVEQVGDYPFSTLIGLLGDRQLVIPMGRALFDLSRTLLRIENESDLEWLNTPFSTEQIEIIRKGFRRVRFALPKTRIALDKVDQLIKR